MKGLRRTSKESHLNEGQFCSIGAHAHLGGPLHLPSVTSTQNTHPFVPPRSFGGSFMGHTRAERVHWLG